MSQPRLHPLVFSSGPILTSLNSSPQPWGPRYLLGLIILKLNVQAVLDPNLHLDGGVQLWVRAECVDYDVHLFDNIIEAAADGGSKEIPVGDGCVVKEHSQSPHAASIHAPNRPTGEKPLQWLTFGALYSFENLPLWTLLPEKNEHMHYA